MKVNKIYILVLSLVFTGIAGVNAQTGESEKYAYRMERIRTANPWNTSYNSAGLVFNRNEDFSLVRLGYDYQKGSYRNVFEPTSEGQFKLNTESFRKIKKVYFYGNFDFDYSHRQNKAWASVLDPYRTPVFLADSTPGRQTLELYRVNGGVGYELSKHFAIGGRMDFEVANNAKKRDARNKNVYMSLQIAPGVMYRSKWMNLGLNFIYGRRTEKVDIRIYGTGQNHEIFEFDGLWFYTSDVIKESGTMEREYRDNIYGGAAQLELYGKRWRFFNQLAVTKGKEEIFRNKAGDDRGGEVETLVYDYDGVLQITGDKYDHRLKWAADFTTTLLFENLQRSVIIDQSSQIVQYGRKNKSDIDAVKADVSYTLYRNRTAYNSSWNLTAGGRGYIRENKYRMFPVEFKHEVKSLEGYLDFTKNFLFKKGMLDCGIGGSYAEGSGTLLDRNRVSPEERPDIDLYKQRKDLLWQEYEFLTSDKFSLNARFRYTYFLNKEKGMSLYADARLNYLKVISGIYKSRERTGIQAVIGLAF